MNLSPQEAEVLQFFYHNIKHDQLYHAYIFVGSDITSLKDLVMSTTQMLLCKNLQQQPCNNCDACTKVIESVHPDVIWKDTVDKKSLNIAEVREISAQVALKPWEGRHKVFVLPAIDNMGIEAANALLKTLEEPTGHSVFLLTAEKTATIPETILSRCQLVRVGNLGIDATVQALAQENFAVQDAEIAAILADGNISLARNILQNHWEIRQQIVHLFTRQQDPIALAEVFNQFCGTSEEGRQNTLTLLTYICSFIRDLLLIKMNAPDNVMNKDARETLQQVADRYTVHRLNCFLDFILQARRMVQSNVTLSLICENVALRA